MEIKTKKIIVAIVVVIIFVSTAFYVVVFKKDSGIDKYVSEIQTQTQTKIMNKDQADNEVKMLREELFSGKNDEVIKRVETSPIDASSNFVEWEKYHGMQKIYLAFAYAAKGDRVGALDELKKIIDDLEYHPDQKAFAAMEIAYNLTTFDAEDLKNHLFNDGELKKSYVDGNLHETSKNIYELSYRFRPTPLSSYALSDYCYEKAAELKETKLEESNKMAEKGAQYLETGNELSKTMRTPEWVIDNNVRTQLYKAMIHERINRMNLYAGDNVVYDQYEIEYVYKDILNATTSSKMTYYTALTKLNYAMFIDNVYGYNERKNDVDSLTDGTKNDISKDEYGLFERAMQEIKSRPDDSFEKKEILDLMNKSPEFREVMKSVGWQ